jgi:hypothetical protein
MTVHVTAPMLVSFNHFISVGFVENGAGATVGNFCQESGEFLIATMFRAHPDASGGVPEALKSGGIAEWLGSRKTAYIAFSARVETRLGLTKGSLLNDLGTQCDFVVYELQTNPKYARLYQQLTSGSRSIANLTANFCWEYENPDPAAANLDNRIAHAEAVVAKARALKAGQPVPQQAPTVVVPQVPVPQVPPVVLPAPATPAGLPPISASSAGRRTAVLDNLEAMRTAYLKERASIDAEITIIETTIADFGKLAPMMIPAAALPKPAADPAVATPQRSKKVLGPNWITSVFGTGSIAGAVATVVFDIVNKQTPDAASISLIFSSLMAGFGLIQAKDKNVTGGTISNVTGAVGKPVSLVEMENQGGVRVR